MKTPSDILDSPDSSPWLKTALRTALEQKDMLLTVKDAFTLATCLQVIEYEHIIKTELGEYHTDLANEALNLLHNNGFGPNPSQRDKIYDILRKIEGTFDIKNGQYLGTETERKNEEN